MVIERRDFIPFFRSQPDLMMQIVVAGILAVPNFAVMHNLVFWH